MNGFDLSGISFGTAEKLSQPSVPTIALANETVTAALDVIAGIVKGDIPASASDRVKAACMVIEIAWNPVPVPSFELE